MSGTSLDGVDGVLVHFSNTQIFVIAHAHRPFNAPLRAELLALNQAGDNELHRAAMAANQCVNVYAEVVTELISISQLSKTAIAAIGVHGQTVRHQPRLLGTHMGYSWQLNNPALLAEYTGIAVVADFRSRDIAAGGQGAPLVPAFHAAVFGQPKRTVAVLNIGGISNLSVINADILGFDCGPGNALMDLWCQRHTQALFDENGTWAKQGKVHPELLRRLLGSAYFIKPPPKSTGRDLFNADWLEQQLAEFATIAAVDVQATLTEFTAQTCANSVAQYAKDATELIVCGGGVLNRYLMERIQIALGTGVTVVSSAQRGLPPQQVEAAAFAWLANQTLLGLPGNLAQVTGAKGARILGAIYPA